MFLILSMLMICSAHGSESDENNTLTLTGECTRESVDSGHCNLVPEHLVKGISRIKLLNVDFLMDVSETDDFKPTLKEYMFGVYLRNITYLEISNNIRILFEIVGIGQNAFKRLKKLEELHIHLDYLRIINVNAFSGLSALKTLNLNGCKRLIITDTVVSALSSNQLPLLENLYLSGTDKVDWCKLTSFERRLRKLDISSTRIICDPQISLTLLNITGSTQYQPSLTTLEYLNISATYFDLADVFFFESGWRVLTHLDISHITFEKIIWIESEYLKVLNISDILKDTGHRDGLVMKLIATYISVFQPWWIKPSLVLECRNLIVEVLELKENSFKFIGPNALACFKFAKNINLSENKLFTMMKDHPDQFEMLI